MIEFYKKSILFTSKRNIKEGDLVYIRQKKCYYPFLITVGEIKYGVIKGSGGVGVRLDSARRVKWMISFRSKEDEIEKIKLNDNVCGLSAMIDDLECRLKRESFIISKTDLNGLISVLPDANLVGTKSLTEDDLKKINVLYQYKKPSGEIANMVVKCDGIIMRGGDVVDGIKVVVNGQKVDVMLRKGKFNCAKVEVDTYYWSIWPSVISDEAMFAMNEAVCAFTKVVGETLSGNGGEDGK